MIASTPSCSPCQKLAGLSAPPGKRQPIPMIAIGSVLASVKSSSLDCIFFKASKARFNLTRLSKGSEAFFIFRHPVPRCCQVPCRSRPRFRLPRIDPGSPDPRASPHLLLEAIPRQTPKRTVSGAGVPEVRQSLDSQKPAWRRACIARLACRRFLNSTAVKESMPSSKKPCCRSMAFEGLSPRTFAT